MPDRKMILLISKNKYFIFFEQPHDVSKHQRNSRICEKNQTREKYPYHQ